MPSKIKVQKLKELTLNYIEDYVCSAIRNALEQHPFNSVVAIMESPEWKKAATYFQDWLLPEFTDQIMRAVIQTNLISTKYQYAAVALLFSDTTEEIRFDRFQPAENFQTLTLDLLNSRSHQGSLKRIDFGILVECEKSVIWKYMTDRNNWLTNLNVLKIPYACDDSMLAAIGVFCNNLTLLDIHNSQRVTGNGILSLCFGNVEEKSERNKCCATLQYFDLHRTIVGDVNSEAVGIFISNITTLVSLCEYEYTGDALLHGNNPTATNLCHVRDFMTQVPSLQNINSRCPHLQSLYLDTPESKTLRQLSLLENITKLKVNRCSTSDLDTYFLKPNKLRTLELVRVRGTVDLRILLKQSPHMQVLYIYHADLVSYSFTSDFDSVKHNLTVLKISRYTSLSSEDLRNVLISCPKLEKVHVDTCPFRNDQVMEYIIGFHALSNLQCLYFYFAEYLTSASVWLLLQNCPVLRELWISGWNVPTAVFTDIKNYCNVNNLDIRLC